VGHVCNPSYSGGSQFKASLGKWFVKAYLKNMQKKSVGRVVQAVERCLASALSSNPSNKKKKKKKLGVGVQAYHPGYWGSKARPSVQKLIIEKTKKDATFKVKCGRPYL
jgi:hypothetical protein